MPLMIVALAVTLFLAIASWSLIVETSQGKRWIRLSLQSADRPEAVLARIETAWAKNALTFEPVEILAESDAEEKKFTLAVGDTVYRTTLRRLASQEPMSIVLTCLAANGKAFPLSREHRKIWQVVPNGTGSLVRVAVTFRAPPGAILQAIFTFRRQLRIIAGS